MTEETPRPVLLLGATSDIGRAILTRYAEAGRPVQLAGRDPAALDPFARDFALRHRIEATVHAFDALALDTHEAFFDALPATPSVVIMAVGALGTQESAETDPAEAARIVATNLTGPAWALEVAARRLAALGTPAAIIGLSSVAGDRGRAKNYWYGAAKAGFTAVLSGLRQKYARTPLHVVTVRPGFVATRMTEGMDLPGPLVDRPETIAALAHKAAERGRGVVVPAKWRLVMGVIKALPEGIFKKLKF
ncbi:MAG: SDR family oxidoreductase [Paracoccaceae bacterium]